MSRQIIIVTFFLLLGLNTSAQKKLNFIEVDKTSYELFQQQKWNELIDYSAEARKQGIDFFYLQVRTGIAYYNLKKYRISSKWFLKAWKNDQSFEWLQEYLYYSLVYGGQAAEASKYAVKFTPQMQKKVGFKKSKLTRLALEAGYSTNPDFEQLKEIDLKTEANLGEDYGEAYFLKNYHFESIDLSHQVSPGFYLNHNFTFLSSNREEQVDWRESYSFPIKTNQFQYFINPVFVAGKKLYISPSLSALWGNSEYYVGGITNNSRRQFYHATFNFSDFVFSTSFWSNLGNFAPGAEINLANIYNENFTQLSAWITFYPFSNTNFYLTPRFYFKTDSETSLSYNTFGISGGMQLGPIHLYGQYLTGEMKNFIEAAGYVISNFPGTSDSKFLGSLYFPLGEKCQFVVRYINQNIAEKYQVYTDGILSNSVEYQFTKHTLTGGISWNF